MRSDFPFGLEPIKATPDEIVARARTSVARLGNRDDLSRREQIELHHAKRQLRDRVTIEEAS